MDRHLAGIFFIDVVGYSRLMELDEAGTHERLRSCRSEIIDPNIDRHNGRIVKLMGDGVLAEFASAVDAVACAVAIQRKVGERNGGLPESERIEFRAGVNVGDVIAEDGDIYGDGVNVAARLVGMAEPGGICISGAAFDQLKHKVDAGYEYLGEQQVKNLTQPVRVYRVLLASEAAGKVIGPTRSRPRRWQLATVAASLILVASAGYAVWPNLQGVSPDGADFCQQRSKLELPARPSIAVLPFDDLSSEPNQPFLGDIASEAIITTLAKVPDLFVIARNSTATYKGTPMKVQRVAEELGVRYVIEGSVQQVADRMRVTAQLIDAKTGHHVWAERYDRDAKESLQVMDDIAFNILTELEVNLTEGEQARIRSRGTDNLKAYQLYMQSTKEQLRFNPEGNANARDLARRATEMDPNFWGGWTALGYASTTMYWYGAADKSESFRLGTMYAQKTLEVGGAFNPDAYLLLGFIENWRGNHEESIELTRKALTLSPNMADAWGQLGVILNSAGRPDDAIPVLEKAMRLSPYYATYTLYQLGKSYRHTGRHEKAVHAYRTLICRSPQSTFAHRDLALSYGALDRGAEARDSVAELLKIQPDYSLRDYVEKGDSGIGPEIRAQNIEFLRQAGLPE